MTDWQNVRRGGVFKFLVGLGTFIFGLWITFGPGAVLLVVGAVMTASGAYTVFHSDEQIAAAARLKEARNAPAAD